MNRPGLMNSLDLRKAPMKAQPLLPIHHLAGILLICLSKGIQADTTPSNFMARAGIIDITPTNLPIRLAGSMHPVETSIIHDPLKARIVVLSNASTRMIVGTLDVCVLPEQAFKPLQKGIATATGIPPNHINLSATHTHSAPPLTGLFLNDAETDYLEWMMDTVIDGVIKISHQPEEPVRIGWARAPIPEHVFNRRWLLKEGANYENPFGSHEDRVRMNPGYGNPDISQPSGPTDPILEVLGISRSDGSPLALIGNYSLHYVGGVNGISADYFGAYGNWLKQYFQREYPNKPFVGLLTNGASGDINNLNYALPTPPPKKPPYQKIKEVAQSVASKTAELFEQMSWETQGILAVQNKTIMCRTRRPDQKRSLEAQRLFEKARDKHPTQWTRQEIYARESILLKALDREVPVSLSAIRIGSGCLLTLPTETFSSIGLELKKASPFAHTMVIELANGYHGYLPTPEQHRLGGYETWMARSSYLEIDTSETITRTLQKLLDRLDYEN